MQRQGTDQPRAPERRTRAQLGAEKARKERTGPRRYISEANAELRKVNWPTRREVFNSTMVVLVCVVFMTSLVFGFDYVSSKFVLFLFD